jgi:hypothetical protein
LMIPRKWWLVFCMGCLLNWNNLDSFMSQWILMLLPILTMKVDHW